MFRVSSALRPASIRTLGEPSLARCMLGSECNGGRCNLDVGLGTGKTTQPNQGSRAVARNTAFAGTQSVAMLQCPLLSESSCWARKLPRFSKNDEAEQTAS
jgi:hypothetical protein